MDEKVENMEMYGLNFEPQVLWDILFFGAVRMQIEHDAYGTAEERKNWLMYRIKLSEELMKRLPFEGNAVEEQITTNER